LIDRRRTESLLCAKRLQPHTVVNQWRQVVCVWVAQVNANGAATMLLDYAHEPAFNFCPRFVPRHFNVFAIALNHWFAKTVWVFVQLLQRAALWANETFAKYVVAVASDSSNGPIFHGDL
jgi:hypothetical protein